jgi:hypothetical protein
MVPIVSESFINLNQQAVLLLDEPTTGKLLNVEIEEQISPRPSPFYLLSI